MARYCENIRYFSSNREKDEDEHVVIESEQKKHESLLKYFRYGETIKENKTIQDIQDLLIEMEKRKYNTWMYIAILCTLVMYFGYEIITHWLSDQASVVSHKYLENKMFQEDIAKFSENTIHELTKSESVKEDIEQMLKSIVINLTADKDVTGSVEKMLGKAVSNLSKEEYIVDSLADLFENVLKSEKIVNSGNEIANEIVMELLYDDEYEELREFVATYLIEEIQKILLNENIQKSAGNLSWNAFKYAVFGSNSSKNEKESFFVEETEKLV